MINWKAIGIILLLIGGIIGIGAIGTAIAMCSKDDNGNGVRDCLDPVTPDPPSPTLVPVPTGGPTPTVSPSDTIFVSGALDLNNDKDYDDIGEIPPKEGAGIVIAITALDMDTLYNVNHELNSKIFLLEPRQSFKEYVTLDVRGGNIASDNRVCVQFRLLEGTLVGPTHEHKGNITSDNEICYSGLDTGETIAQIEGIVPDWSPGHDWHLGNVRLELNGGELPSGTVSNRRLDEPENYRWMTKRYKNDWCEGNDERLDSDECALDATIGTSGQVTLKINFDDRPQYVYLTNPFEEITVTQLTYPGKYRIVYKGLPTDHRVIGTIYEIKIDSSELVSMGADAGYFHIKAKMTDGTFLDFNKSPDDAIARVGIDNKIIGGKQWESDKEYFDMLGILKGFSVVGGNHPESQWFE